MKLNELVNGLYYSVFNLDLKQTTHVIKYNSNNRYPIMSVDGEKWFHNEDYFGVDTAKGLEFYYATHDQILWLRTAIKAKKWVPNPRKEHPTEIVVDHFSTD